MNFIKKIKYYLIVIFCLTIISSAFFFYEKKVTIKNTNEADTKLTDSGFKNLYSKTDNEFCVEEEDVKKQENIARDMMWTLELEGKKYQKIEKIDCKNGKKGIKVR